MKRMQMTVKSYAVFDATCVKNGKMEKFCKLHFEETDEEPVFSAESVTGMQKLLTLLDWGDTAYLGGLKGKRFMVVFQEPFHQIYALGNEKGEFIKVNGDEDMVFKYSEL